MTAWLPVADETTRPVSLSGAIVPGKLDQVRSEVQHPGGVGVSLHMAELIAAVTAAGNAATRTAADPTMPPDIRTQLAAFSDCLARDELVSGLVDQ